MENETQTQQRRTPKFLHHCCYLIFLFIFFTLFSITQAFHYGDALSKSLLYFEAQRSGRLPYNQRVTWRHHSGLTDGLEQGVRSISYLFFSLHFLDFG